MSRNAIIAITIGAIIILGAIAAFLWQSQNKSSTENKDSTTITKEEETTNNKMGLSTITDIFTRGENQMCTFEAGGDEGVTTGTIYVSGDNARGEFMTTISNDESYEAFMIRNGNTFYTWTSDTPTGVKMTVNSVDEWTSEAAENEIDEGSFSGFDPSINYNFECKSWTVDEKLFEAPTNINFMSIDGMMNTNSEEAEDEDDVSSNSLPQIPCNLCESMTDDAKNLCLQQCQ